MTLSPETAVSRNGTILFVDDEPLSQKYFKASIGKYAKVLTASNPDAALKIMAAEGDTISVVVSDERMPYESGVSFLSNVRKSWPSTVRILTSAYANIDNLQQAINGAAIYRFLPKPWDIDELCQAMKDALLAERAAEQVTKPLEGPLRGDAENASIELLTILTRELTVPLGSLDHEALQLALLTGARASGPSQSLPSQMASWSSQLRLGQIAASATRVQRDVEYCRSLAGSISELAAGLGSGPVQTPSMAETAQEAVEHVAVRKTDRKMIKLSASPDFHYRAPKKIMSFVLVSLLQEALRQATQSGPSEIAIELVSGFDSNEVRITSQARPESDVPEDVAAQNAEAHRAIRCALWAFGGELIHSPAQYLGNATTTVRLPKADMPEGVSSSH